METYRAISKIALKLQKKINMAINIYGGILITLILLNRMKRYIGDTVTAENIKNIKTTDTSNL